MPWHSAAAAGWRNLVLPSTHFPRVKRGLAVVAVVGACAEALEQGEGVKVELRVLQIHTVAATAQEPRLHCS